MLRSGQGETNRGIPSPQSFTMKVLSFILAFAAMGSATAADVAWVTPTGGSVTAPAGSTYGSLTLNYDMTTGSPSSHEDYSDVLNSVVDIKGGSFYAGDYTVSLWLPTEQLSTNKILFFYCGGNSNQVQGCNGITWDADNKKITIGQGQYVVDGRQFNFYGSNKSTSGAITLGGDNLINMTFSVKGGDGSQTATLWVNGEKVQTLAAYNGNMNNEATPMKLFFDPNTVYGRIAITNEALTTAAQIATLANVPEPATATLSLLALSGLILRRRRKSA